MHQVQAVNAFHQLCLVNLRQIWNSINSNVSQSLHNLSTHIMNQVYKNNFTISHEIYFVHLGSIGNVIQIWIELGLNFRSVSCHTDSQRKQESLKNNQGQLLLRPKMLWNKLKTKAIRMSKQWIYREISLLSLTKFYSPDLTNIVTVLISWARFGKKRRHTDKKLGKFKGQNPSLVRVRRSNDIFCDGFTSIHKGFQSKLTSCGEKNSEQEQLFVQLE